MAKATPLPNPAAIPAGRPGHPVAPPAGPAIRVLCVDDHSLLVDGLRAQFAIDGRLGVVGWLPSAETLMAEVQNAKPDLLLLDIEMPGPDVFEIADRLRHMHPGLRMVFLSAHVRDGYLTAAFRCGAWGYFAKGDEPEDIVRGLLEVAHSATGTFVMGPKVRERCAATPPARAASLPTVEGKPLTPLASLTPREIEIVRLIGKGLSRTEIAAELSRSAKTIDGHQDRIMKKLGIDSRSDLLRFAIREGLAQA